MRGVKGDLGSFYQGRTGTGTGTVEPLMREKFLCAIVDSVIPLHGGFYREDEGGLV